VLEDVGRLCSRDNRYMQSMPCYEYDLSVRNHYLFYMREKMTFIKIKTNSLGDEELINLNMIVNIFKEDRELAWKEPYGIRYATDETFYESHFAEENKRNKYFDELVKMLTT
jgi:hypothetical protein